MDDTTAHLPSVSKSKRGGYGCLFFFCLIFMIGGAIPTLLSFPGVVAHFTGVETTALVTADGACSWEESDNGSETTVNGYYYIYTFTVASGRTYQIITNTNCSNGDTIGARETIWYQPADPTTFLTASAWNFDWLFFLGFSIPMLLFAFVFFRRLFRRLFTPSRRFTEMQRGERVGATR